MPYPARYDALLAGLADVFDAEPDVDGPRTARALTTTPQPGSVDAADPCALDAMIRACLSGSAHPAARAALGAMDLLGWGVNPVADRMTKDAATICAVLTLMGPDGPIPAPDLRLGLLYQRPNTYYPLHNHDADETYVILAGSALWTAGDDTRHRGAGEMIHHPSLTPHAFRAGNEGFVALWRWSGDINTHSYAFLDDAAAFGDPAALTA